MLNYKIAILKPQSHYAKVTITVKSNTNDLHFTMPAWTPGSYLMREFGKSVDVVLATLNNKQVEVIKIDKNTWKVPNAKDKTVVFSYDVYAFELSVRTSFIDFDQAAINPTSICMQVDECKQIKGTLTLEYPKNWSAIHTPLEKNGMDFLFTNYDELGDSPIQIGNHTAFSFNVRGVLHEVAMVGQNNADITKLKVDMERMCSLMCNVIDVMPCKKYVFIVQNVENGGGGLEHSNATTLMMNRWAYTNTDKYHQFLGLVAHEYFHLWNVKRLRPIELGPFDYKNENYTTLLWMAEGFTSYYDEWALYKYGYYSKEKYVQSLQGYINKVEQQPGTRVQTVAESSLDAWTKSYRPNENSKNTGISYYQKGLVIAMLLDARIIEATKGTKNLNDLMRYLYAEYAVKLNVGFTHLQFLKAVEKLTGVNMDAELNEWINTTTVLPYSKVLKSIGLILNEKEITEPVLGIKTNLEGGKTIITEIASNSYAANYDLSVNDEIIAINDIRILNNVNEVLNQIGKPNAFSITLSRSSIIKVVNLTKSNTTYMDYTISIDKNEPFLTAFFK